MEVLKGIFCPANLDLAIETAKLPLSPEKKDPFWKEMNHLRNHHFFKEKIVRSFQEICYFYRVPRLKAQPTGPADKYESHNRSHKYLPAQTMHIKKRKFLENYHRFVKVWFPPKWVPYNDPRNNLTHFFLIGSWSLSSPCRKVRGAFTTEPCKRLDLCVTLHPPCQWKIKVKKTSNKIDHTYIYMYINIDIYVDISLFKRKP